MAVTHRFAALTTLMVAEEERVATLLSLNVGALADAATAALAAVIVVTGTMATVHADILSETLGSIRGGD